MVQTRIAVRVNLDPGNKQTERLEQEPKKESPPPVSLCDSRFELNDPRRQHLTHDHLLAFPANLLLCVASVVIHSSGICQFFEECPRPRTNLYPTVWIVRICLGFDGEGSSFFRRERM